MRRWLEKAPPSLFTAYATVAAFSTYFTMYAFRKPFAVATFEGTFDLSLLPPVGLKTAYIIAQMLGYASAKFLGIRIIAEMPAPRRARWIIILVGAAELSLGLFAVVPPSYGVLCLIANGLPLGMIWGLVFGFVEGRRVSDLLGAGLCASFIVASGFVKTVGKWVLEQGVPEHTMPVVTGLLFTVPFLLSVWLLKQIPPPTAEDEAARTQRAPMDGPARRRFVRAHWPGLACLVPAYILLAAYRDFRDNFAREIWDALGFENEPAILTTAELPVAAGSLLTVAFIMLVRDNQRALAVVHGMMFFGSAGLLGGSTILYAGGVINPAVWMIAVGLGLYMGYVPFNCVLFDRMIAALGSVATAGFLIYIADAFGYMGSMAVLLYKNFGRPDLSWLQFLVGFSYATAIVGSALFAGSGWYFWRVARR